MHADIKSIRDILGSSEQYLVPFFQRSYSWRPQHWDHLWNDLMGLLNGTGVGQHFMGSIVCTLDKDKQESGRPRVWQLIDGQQRLTTLLLVLAAVRDFAGSRKDERMKQLAEVLSEDVLINRRQPGNHKLKLIPRIGDRQVFLEIIEGRQAREHLKLGVGKAAEFFRLRIQNHTAKFAKSKVFDFINKLQLAVREQLNLVHIQVDPLHAYEIFESLNDRGLELEKSDLVRNFVFMKIPRDEQEAFQEKYWGPFEQLFSAENQPAKVATKFYRDYLMRNGEYVAEQETFPKFRTYVANSGLTLEKLAKELQHFARLEMKVRRPTSVLDPKLRHVCARLQLLDMPSSFPLTLNLLDRVHTKAMSVEDVGECVRDLISFVVRRTVCGEATRHYNDWFVEAIRKIKSSPADDLRRYWTSRGWPDDARFKQALVTFPLYQKNQGWTRLLLEALEYKQGNKESLKPEELQIEHVMPIRIGKTGKGRVWRKELGDDFEELHRKWLHTVGNLTLTGLNQEMGNRTFRAKKKDLLGRVILNKYFSPLRHWNAEKIEERGKELASTLSRIFPRPASAGEYVPSPDAEVLTGELTDAEQNRVEYWKRFNETLRSLGSDYTLETDQVDAARRYVWETGLDGVTLGVQPMPKRRTLYAWVAFAKSAERHYQWAKKRRGEIEEELGQKLEWNDERLFVQAERTDIDVRSPDTYDEQFNWFYDRMDGFDRSIIVPLTSGEEE